MKRKKLTVDSVFNKFEDEDSDDMPRKRKLVPLDYGDEDKSSKGNVNTEEKRKHIKSLIEKIPTAKPELFAYPLDWSIVDSVSVKFYAILSVTCKILVCILSSVCATVPVQDTFSSNSSPPGKPFLRVGRSLGTVWSVVQRDVLEAGNLRNPL